MSKPRVIQLSEGVDRSPVRALEFVSQLSDAQTNHAIVATIEAVDQFDKGAASVDA